MAGPPPPAPVSLLGRHRLLAPSASVRVSPLSLGGMSLGNKWAPMMGECTKETAFELLDTYYGKPGVLSPRMRCGRLLTFYVRRPWWQLY